MAAVFSYIRFSSKPQERGASLRRQKELLDRWLVKHPEHKLDTSLTLRDLGKSAFRSAHLDPKTGDLGKFIALAKQPNSPIKPNSILAIEHLDRFSRDEAYLALHVLTDLIQCGVRILTLEPERMIDKSNAGKMEVLLPVVLDLIIAHESSLRKSTVGDDNWARKRATASKKPISAQCPRWLRLSKDRTRFEVIPEAVSTIKKIYKMALDGQGIHSITKALNQERVPTISKGKRKATMWLEGSVFRLLSDRTLLGEYQPHRGHNATRKPIGDPIANYYPQIVKPADFLKVQQRRKLNSAGRKPRGRVSLFPRLLRDAIDKSPMILTFYGVKHRMVSQAGKNGKGNGYRSFPYDRFEAAFLRFASELTTADIEPHGQSDDTADRIAQLELTLADKDKRIATLRKRIDADSSLDILMDDVARLAKQRAEIVGELDTLKASVASPVAETLRDAQSIVEALQAAKGDSTTIRNRLRVRIAELIERIWVYVYIVEVPKSRKRRGMKKLRIADCQVCFKAGGVRSICIPADGDSVAMLSANAGRRNGLQVDLPVGEDLSKFNARRYKPLWDVAQDVSRTTLAIADTDGRDYDTESAGFGRTEVERTIAKHNRKPRPR